MYGFLTTAKDLLSEEEAARYKACYCGLCRYLKTGYGQLSRLTLSYDMTFLVLFFNSLYEPEERDGMSACVVHPFEKKEWWGSSCTEYAADMTVALAYLKAKDNWTDDKNLLSLAETGALSDAYRTVREKYPATFSEIERNMARLSDIEKSREYLPDETADCFGGVMRAVFRTKNDRWSEACGEFGYHLGKFIYLLDAAVDLDKDRIRERYNPFRPRYGHTDNEQFFREILEICLGDCLRAFDYLPLVRDAGIMKNILCVGLWQAFYQKYPQKDGPSDVSGSIQRSGRAKRR